MKPPLARPCGSCPYRKDVPSGIWHEEEYAKLPRYDGPSHEQPTQVFGCHQANGHLCSGWVGCHDMDENLALRIGLAMGEISPEDVDTIRNYQSPVPLFDSGQEAADHGLADVPSPGPRAHRVMQKLRRKGVGDAGPVRPGSEERPGHAQ